MSLRGRSLLIGLMSIFMVFLCVPSLMPAAVREASPWIPDQAINPGLDLQGGIYWLMRIDRADVIDQRLEQALATLDAIESEEGLSLGTVEKRADEEALRICGADPTAFEDVLDERFPRWQADSGDDGCLRMTLSRAGLDDVVSLGVDQAIEVLQNRLTEGGFVEPIIAKQGDDRILVQMPGSDYEDRQRAEDLISKTTRLEFKKVLASAENEGLLVAAYPNGLPEETEVVTQLREDAEEGEGEVVEALLVPSKPLLTGANLQDAGTDFDQRTQRPVVTFAWDGEGTQKFREFTGENIGERMAIITDGNVISAPRINGRIGQRGQIEGDFTLVEARTLAVRLRAGALPVNLVIEEERTIGPSLGEDSIRAGLQSIAVGGLVVVVFMLVYYRTAGVFANLALVLNLIIVLAVMSSFRATLTLPGIAGLVLTVGMAVDANVIIFERIREELRAGRAVRSAVQIGFNRSRWTILDANITTLIAAIVLYYVGHGPVQGFGVTLVIGIFASVFSALVVTRLLFDLLLARGGQSLRI